MSETAKGASADAAAIPAFVPLSADGKPISNRYRNYILLLLAASYGLNFGDRQMLSILMPAIKGEMHFTDTEVGILAGPMFALVFSIMGLPLATLADRGNRRNLISWTLLLFSAATAACGLATNFLHLAIARVVTGFGEAGTTPAANSTITNLFPPERRAFATSVFTAGGTFGVICASFIGGRIAYYYGWREAFFVAGIPGLLLAALIYFTAREPMRTASRLTTPGSTVTTWATLKQLWSQPAFRWIATGDATLVFANRGSDTFRNIFLVQTHHLNLKDLGTIQALFGILGVCTGMLIGLTVDKLSKRDIRWFVFIPSIIAIMGVPFTLTLLLAPTREVAIGVGLIGSLFAGAYIAPIFAATQQLVPAPMRARSIAVLLLILTLVGLGIGPVFTGVASDYFAKTFGKEDGLRYSLLLLLVPACIACFAFLRASVHLKANIAKARAIDAGTA